MALDSARALGYFENGFKNGELPPDLTTLSTKIGTIFVDWNEVLECDGEQASVVLGNIFTKYVQ